MHAVQHGSQNGWLCKYFVQVQVNVAGVGKDKTHQQAEAWTNTNSAFEHGRLKYSQRGSLGTDTGLAGGREVD